MNNINKLSKYLKKQGAGKLDYTETATDAQPTTAPTPASITSAGMVPEAPKVTDGGENVPRQDRLYLVNGIIPGTNKNPTDLGLKPYQGIEKKDAQFIDKRQIHRRHKGLLNEIHGDIHADKSFGGIVINQDGQVLLRKPKGKGFGNDWTLAKGGADKGESGSDAALREVLEETGITGKVVKELAGHYNADNKGNKFYLMEVDTSVDPQPFKGADKGNEETSEIKWADLDEAMELLEKGESQEKADRDVQVIRQGHREWEGRNKRASFHKAIGEAANKMSAGAIKLNKELGDYFAKNGEFPQTKYDDNGEVIQLAMRDDPYYEPMLAEISSQTLSPRGGGEHYGMLKGLMVEYLKKIDEQKGQEGAANFIDLHSTFAYNWGNDAMKTEAHPNMVAHAIADIRGYPETWIFGHSIPPDLDFSGRPIFRSDKLRNEMIDAYDEWKADKTDGKGFLSNGEKYNFNKSKPVQYRDLVDGKPVKKTAENHWDLVMGRAKAVKDKKEDLRKNTKWSKSIEHYKEYGADYLTSQGKDTSKLSEDEIIEAGKEFVKEYARTAQNITQSLLRAALPEDVHHLYTVRKASSPREIGGEFGIGGNTPAGSESLPSSASETSGAAGMSAPVVSGVLSGASTNPTAYMAGKYAIFRRTNIRDIFMIQSLWHPGKSVNSFGGERELIVMNNPNSEARVVHQKGKIWNAKTWDVADSRTGIIPKGVMGYEGKRYGVTDPKIDYKTVLKPATAQDNPMVGEHKGGKLGTNPGQIMKNPKTGEQFYLKHSSEDGKNASEDLANKLYEVAGIGVPHTELVRYGNGHALKSNWIDDTVHHGTANGKLSGTPSQKLINRPEVKHGFLVDCVLANWDVAGAGNEKPYGNLMEKDGKMIRVDQGGALAYSGLEGQKGGNGSPFWSGHHNPQKNDFLDEIDNLRDEKINPTTAHVFQGMTEDDWDEASSNLMQLTNSRIEDSVNDSGILATDKDKMIDTLKSRRDSALSWWLNHPEIVGKTGYNSLEDLHNKSNLLKQDIFKAVDAELEAHKNQRILWIDEEGYNERLMRTEKEQAESEKDFEHTNELMKIR